jgi:hypothetical protein
MPLIGSLGGASARGFGFGLASGGAGAMTAIASVAVGVDTATVTFSSIPSIYDDLRISVYEYGDPTYSTSAAIRYNSDSGNNYSQTSLFGESTSIGSFGAIDQQTASGLSIQVNQWSTAHVIEIYDYKNTSKFKTSLTRSAYEGTANNGGYAMQMGLWRSTNAITSIQFSISSIRNFDQGCVFELYGVKRKA